MLKISRKTAMILSTFMITSSFISGCASDDNWGDDQNKQESQQSGDEDNNYEDQNLVDDNGKEYTLHHNEDGTETATYKDGDNVTFKRNEDGNLDVVSGGAGLIAGLAAGYFLFHGFSGGGNGYYDRNRNRYSASSAISKVSPSERTSSLRGNGYVPSSSSIGGSKAVTSSKTSSIASSSKGFGSAGSRGGSASS